MFSYPGGETGDALTERALAGLEAVRQHGVGVTVVALHGGILSHLLRGFIPGFGFDDWQGLTNPDVYRLTVGNAAECVRVWDAEVSRTE
jgi:2,3-bisphosphoglycerate-dependent phosphoglycerate mutase